MSTEDNIESTLKKDLRAALHLQTGHHMFDDLIARLATALVNEGYSKPSGWTEGVAPLDTELRYSLLEDSETPKDYAVNEVVSDPRRANIMTDIPMVRNSSFPYADHDQHYLVLDIDHPAQLIQSSTPGHFHLIIEKKMDKFSWIKVLLALSDAGIVQRGYAFASITAGYTSIRLPWVRKGGDDHPIDGRPTDETGGFVRTWAEHDAAVKAVQSNPLSKALENIEKKKAKGKSLRDLNHLPSDVDEGFEDLL